MPNPQLINEIMHALPPEKVAELNAKGFNWIGLADALPDLLLTLLDLFNLPLPPGQQAQVHTIPVGQPQPEPTPPPPHPEPPPPKAHPHPHPEPPKIPPRGRGK